MAVSCYSCLFFNGLQSVRDKYAFQLFAVVGPNLYAVLPSLAVAYLLIQGIQIMLNPGSFEDRLRRLSVKALIAPVITVALTSGATASVPVVYDWVITPIENMSLAFGRLVIETSGVAPSTYPPEAQGDAHTYAQLGYLVEQQVFEVFAICLKLIASGATVWGVINGQALTNIIGAIMLMLPYLFVFGVFAAFMVEAMFKVLAVGIVAPLLVLGILFEPTRPFLQAGMRILLGAALTIVFAAGAMGFTMSIVSTYAAPLRTAVESVDQSAIKVVDSPACAAGTPTFDNAICAQAKERVQQMATGRFTVFSYDFLMLFVIGFASILLHLQAKALASNISGANDGAGPATATVAAGKAVMGGGLYAASRSMFGEGGAGSTAKSLLTGGFFKGVDQNAGGLGQAGQLLQQHGLVAGSAGALINAFRSGGGGSAGDNSLKAAASQAKFSAGGGAAGGLGSLDNKQIQALGKAIGEAISGGGRDRYGNS